MAADLVSGNSWLVEQIVLLWLVTAIVVLIASLIHYVWSTQRRKDLAAKYERRSSVAGHDLRQVWSQRLD
jgi:hypothetical protein